MYFKWKDAYSMGIEQIDNQHKHLFDIGTQIFDLANADDGYDHYDEIMEVLKELEDYTIYHFGYEEKLMESLGYERYEPHKFEHYFLLKKVQKFKEKDIDEKQRETVMELTKFISDWVTNHILKEDMRYKDFFISKGIK